MNFIGVFQNTYFFCVKLLHFLRKKNKWVEILLQKSKKLKVFIKITGKKSKKFICY